MSHHRRIPLLVAVRPHLRQLVLDLLPDTFLPTICHSFHEAIHALARERFGMVLCSVQFDENKLYDLLRHIRETVDTYRLPFVAAMMDRYAGDARTRDAAVKSLALLGVDNFVNCSEFLQQGDISGARGRLRDALLRFAPPSGQEDHENTYSGPLGLQQTGLPDSSMAREN